MMTIQLESKDSAGTACKSNLLKIKSRCEASTVTVIKEKEPFRTLSEKVNFFTIQIFCLAFNA